tara:strand:+ start:1658 stop:1822 length:165 start_codon:yes stop_codon:yes gene_type:complete
MRYAGIKAGYVPAYGSRPMTKKGAELFLRACKAVNGDLYCFRVERLPIELPYFI